MLREYSVASMLRNPKLVGLLDSLLGNTPDCHLPYVQVKPICALSDSAPSFRLALSTICRIFVLKHSNFGESYETLCDLPHVHDHRRQNPRRSLGQADRKSTRLNSSHANISYAV